MQDTSKTQFEQLTTSELATGLFGVGALIQAQCCLEPDLQGGLVDNLELSEHMFRTTDNLLNFLRQFDELPPLEAIDFARQMLSELEGRIQAERSSAE